MDDLAERGIDGVIIGIIGWSVSCSGKSLIRSLESVSLHVPVATRNKSVAQYDTLQTLSTCRLALSHDK